MSLEANCLGTMRSIAARAPPVAQLSARVCGFCGKSETEVPTLIQAPIGYICNGCVKICANIIAKNEMEVAQPEADPVGHYFVPPAWSLCLRCGLSVLAHSAIPKHNFPIATPPATAAVEACAREIADIYGLDHQRQPLAAIISRHFPVAEQARIADRMMAEFNEYWNRHPEFVERSSAHPVTELQQRMAEVYNQLWSTDPAAAEDREVERLKGEVERLTSSLAEWESHRDGLIEAVKTAEKAVTTARADAIQEAVQTIKTIYASQPTKTKLLGVKVLVAALEQLRDGNQGNPASSSPNSDLGTCYQHEPKP